jgi:hypothetical protein
MASPRSFPWQEARGHTRRCDPLSRQRAASGYIDVMRPPCCVR